MKTGFLLNKKLVEVNEKLGLDRTIADIGKITSGSIAFVVADNKTVEKKTDAISLTTKIVHPDSLYLLAIEKPIKDPAGNLTANTYNIIKIDETNARDVLHTTHTVEKITGADTYRNFIIQGLFIGEGKIKIGCKFAVNLVGSTWAASTSYSLGALVEPTTPNNFVYECVVAGTSAATEPSWPTTEGETVDDNTVTWKCWSKAVTVKFKLYRL